MKKLSLIIVMLLLITVFPQISFAENNCVIYVATTGSDTSGNGTISAPYATVNKAVAASRGYSGSKRIRIRGGKYPIASQINLNSRDNNLTIENYPGEDVAITGGKTIPFSAFTKVTDEAVLSRIIEKSGKDAVMQVYLPELGITSYGALKTIGFSWVSGSGYSPTLTCNSKYMEYACYPNEGYLLTDTVIKDGKNDPNGLAEVEFTIKDDRWKQWRNAEDPWALGFLCHDWADFSAPAKFNEASITSYVGNGNYYYALPNRRVKFYNLLEELDAPGEYYLNRKTGYLYIIPPEGIKPTDEFEFTSAEINGFVLSSCKNVTFQGITLKNLRRTGIYAEKCSNITINNCEFSAIGDWAIKAMNCPETVVKNSYLHDLSSGGIYIIAGDRPTLTPGNSLVENCRIERFMHYRRTYSPAVRLEGVGNKVSHCRMSDAPHEAVEFKGNNLIMEYCDIENVCNDTADCGAIYMGRDWTRRGCEIRYNYFHNIKSIDTTTGMKVQAVYLDDAFSSAKVYGNVIYKCSSVALYGGGRYNTFENNIVLECERPFVFDARCTTWMACGEGSTMMNNLKAMPYNTSEAWIKAYPELVGILDDEPQYPKHNTITGNIIYKTPDYQIDPLVYKYGTVDNNKQIYRITGFVDYANEDFTLKETSEIYNMLPDFPPIDFKIIGTYDFEYDNSSTVPRIVNPRLDEASVAGSPLTLTYNYSSGGFAEGNSKIEWFKKENGKFVKIPDENEKTLSTSIDEAGTEIYAEITPVNCEGVWGKKMRTNTVTLKRIPINNLVKISKTGTEVNLTNNSELIIPIGVFTPEYTTENGYKIMTSLKISAGSIAQGDILTYSSDKSIAMCTDSLEPINEN